MADWGIQLLFTQLFGRAASNYLGMMPLIMVVLVCVFYAPIVYDVVLSAFSPDHQEP